MQEPQRYSYSEGHQESVGYPASEDFGDQAGWIRPQYEGQQKLQPEREAKLSTTNYVFAILSMIASQIIFYLSIGMFVVIANIFSRTVGSGIASSELPKDVFGLIIGGFVVSLILLLFSIAGLVFSIIQLANIQNKRKRSIS